MGASDSQKHAEQRAWLLATHYYSLADNISPVPASPNISLASFYHPSAKLVHQGVEHRGQDDILLALTQYLEQLRRACDGKSVRHTLSSSQVQLRPDGLEVAVQGSIHEDDSEAVVATFSDQFTFGRVSADGCYRILEHTSISQAHM